jgi:hypothetical protein
MTISSSEKRRRSRIKCYHEQGGKCYWCGNPMLLDFDHDTCTKTRHFPDNLCTLDHLFDRFHLQRQVMTEDKRHVAACKKCNEERGRQRVAERPKEDLWARSGRYPEHLRKKHVADYA